MRLARSHPAALIPVVLVLFCSVIPHQSRFCMPGVVIWAWERPEDLRFLDVRRTGVAFLGATAQIAPNGSIRFRPRTQSLLLPKGAAAIAVVRIESPAVYRIPNPAAMLAGLRTIAAEPNVEGLQIDYDARASERDFYRSLIQSMRRLTPKPIGITALASWCTGDRWLDAEPIGEAVPMFFRMGGNERRDMFIESPICRSSIGLSLDEPWPGSRPASVGRIYLFNPHAWTQQDYLTGLRRIQEWK